jgi:hypothetical protein
MKAAARQSGTLERQAAQAMAAALAFPPLENAGD